MFISKVTSRLWEVGIINTHNKADYGTHYTTVHRTYRLIIIWIDALNGDCWMLEAWGTYIGVGVMDRRIVARRVGCDRALGGAWAVAWSDRWICRWRAGMGCRRQLDSETRPAVVGIVSGKHPLFIGLAGKRYAPLHTTPHKLHFPVDRHLRKATPHVCTRQSTSDDSPPDTYTPRRTLSLHISKGSTQ